MKNDPIFIAIDVLYKLNEIYGDYRNDLANELVVPFLKSYAEKMGTRTLARDITPHPTKGHMTTYTDNKVEGMINEQYQKDVDKAEEMLKEILK